MDTQLQSEDERKFQCSECGRAYRHAGSLANHKKTHVVGVFQCNICGKENSNALSLKNHLRSHTSHKKYPCLQCGKAFHRPSQLVIHERLHASSETKEHSVNEEGVESVTHEDQNKLTDSFSSSGIPTDACPPEDTSAVFSNSAQYDRNDLDRPFKCELCDKSYIHQRSLSNHMKTHRKGAFECTVCFKLFNNVAALNSHQRTHNSKSDMDSANGPDRSVSLEDFLPQSQDEPANFCHFCEIFFSCEEEFQDHIELHNSSPILDHNNGTVHDNSTDYSRSPLEDESPFVADHNGSFGLPNDQIPIYDHFDDSNLDPESLRVTETGLSTRVPQDTHSTNGTSAVDSEDRPYRCDICFKTYRHYGSLANHKRSHEVGNYQCSLCGKKYPHMAAFKSHLRTHKTPQGHRRRQDWDSPELETMDDQLQNSRDDREPVDDDEDHDLSVSNRHLIQDCGQSGDFEDIKFQHSPSFQQQDFTGDIFENSSDHFNNVDKDCDIDVLDFNSVHMQNDEFGKSENTDDDQEEDDDSDFFQCSMCENRYSNVSDLKVHMQAHSQLDSTPLYSVSSPMSSSKQVKEEELGDMIICCLCGESFSNSQDLVRHQLLHSAGQLDNIQSEDDECEVKNKNLICGSCGMFCISLSHLENHECKVETHQSPTKNDNESEELNEADTSLTEEERQFKCEECGRSYRHAGSLLNHKKSHKTGLFQCHVCQKSFNNLLALKSHQRSHFDIKRFKCDVCEKTYRTQKQLLSHLKGHKKDAEVQTPVQAVFKTDESESDVKEQSFDTIVSEHFSSEGTQEKLNESKSANNSEDSGEKRPFACDQCGRTYRHAGSLANHKNSHKTGEYLCHICSKAYPNQLALKNHLRNHFAFKRHSCLKCGKRFRSKKQLSVHVCSDLKVRKRNLRSNKSSKEPVSSESSSKSERPFVCTICNRSYRHASSLLNHRNTHKTGHYNCTLCPKHFTNLMALRNHNRSHTARKYVCATCGKAFQVASVLLKHQRVHSRGGGRFSCPDCGSSFRARSGLSRHRCPVGQKSSTEDQHSAPARQDKCFKCDLCERSYRHAGSLLTHKKTHSESLHQCTLCLQTFTDPLALDAHSQMRRHSCPECGKTFCLLSHLESHKEVHDKDRTVAENGLSCDAAQNASMEASLSRTKTDSESMAHVCEHCGRTYRHAGSLLNHKNSHKTGRFSCSVCQKEFMNLMALKNHSRIHTEPKRYLCLECGKAFRVSSQLVCHRRIHSRERPFSCSVCGRSFSSKSNLRHHEKMHQDGAREEEFSLDMDISAYL